LDTTFILVLFQVHRGFIGQKRHVGRVDLVGFIICSQCLIEFFLGIMLVTTILGLYSRGGGGRGGEGEDKDITAN